MPKLEKTAILDAELLWLIMTEQSKTKTIVGDNAFIGCNTNLISPVVVNEDTYIAAGSTITEDVPAGSLAIARAKQVNKEGWVYKKKFEKYNIRRN